MSEVQREEALRSALGRLPLAVFVVDGRQLLRPLNAKAASLIEAEGLRGDLLESRPSHPLSRLVRDILHEPGAPPPPRSTLTFPSGARYAVEPSRRSEKGIERWLVLLIHQVDAAAFDLDASLDRWGLTDRERSVARLMAQGESSATICATMQIAATTLKTHVQGVLHKSGSRTRAEFLAKLIPGRG